jgi:hypothetical protein
MTAGELTTLEKTVGLAYWALLPVMARKDKQFIKLLFANKFSCTLLLWQLNLVGSGFCESGAIFNLSADTVRYKNKEPVSRPGRKCCVSTGMASPGTRVDVKVPKLKE